MKRFFILICLVLVAIPSLPAMAASRAQPVTVETYNILGADHTRTGQGIGGSAQSRAQRASRIIRGNTDFPRAMIVGMQEATAAQRRLFDSQLPGYQSVPADVNFDNPIYFDRSRFRLLSSGHVAYPSYGEHGLLARPHGTEARLLDTQTGQVLTVLADHYVAYNDQPGSDRGGAEKRERTARLELARVRQIRNAHPGDTIVILDDTNATNNIPNQRRDFRNHVKDDALQNHRIRLPDCILSQAGSGLQNANDLFRHQPGYCPNRTHNYVLDRLVDRIYVSEQAKITNWALDTSPTAKQASDHFPVLAELALPVVRH